MSMGKLLAVGIILLALVGASQSFYRVYETEKAIVLRFGELMREDVAAGLRFKYPVAEEVKKFDSRVLTLDSVPETYYTLEKKPLIV